MYAYGTVALATGLLTTGTQATAITITVPGVLATDIVHADFAIDPTAVTGFAPAAGGVLTIVKFCTANTINFVVQNNTAGSITPGAMSLNWKVLR